MEQETVADEVESGEDFSSDLKKTECPFTVGKPLSLKTIAHIVYGCQMLSFLFGITAVVGVILNYLRKTKDIYFL